MRSFLRSSQLIASFVLVLVVGSGVVLFAESAHSEPKSNVSTKTNGSKIGSDARQGVKPLTRGSSNPIRKSPVAKVGAKTGLPQSLQNSAPQLLQQNSLDNLAPAPPGVTTIKPGITVGGVSVGNLDVDQAAVLIQKHLSATLQRNILIQADGRTYKLQMAKIGLQLDAQRSARWALNYGYTLPDPVVSFDISPAVTYNQAVAAKFVNGIGGVVYQASRNAAVKITVKRLYRTSSRVGKALDATSIIKKIDAIVADPSSSRVINGSIIKLFPKVTTKSVARLYPAIITIDRRTFKLRLYKNLRFSKTYGVAVGQRGYPTPSGRFRIQSKVVNPTWTAPNSPWTGSMAGSSVKGGAINNPLKARWMALENGVGIHGTGLPGSIGSAASHGCIRMRVPDVIDLYRRVSVGTLVLIR